MVDSGATLKRRCCRCRSPRRARTATTLLEGGTLEVYMRRLLPPILLLICLGLMFLLTWLWPIVTFLRVPWNLVGLVPLVLGGAMGVAGIRRIKKSHTTIKPFGQPSRLVTDRIF